MASSPTARPGPSKRPREDVEGLDLGADAAVDAFAAGDAAAAERSDESGPTTLDLPRSVPAATVHLVDCSEEEEDKGEGSDEPAGGVSAAAALAQEDETGPCLPPDGLADEEEDDAFGDLEGDGDEDVGEEEEDDGLGFDSDDWIRRQKAANVTPEDVLSQLGISVTHAASPDELWRLVAVLISQLRTRMLPRQRLCAGYSTLDDAVRLLSNARSVIVISGAGISVSAGIPDFRSANGVYQMVEERFNLPDPQSLFDIHYFANDPLPFFSFAKNIYPGVFEPTPCHRFIRGLEQRGQLLRNYTQNIDTLEKAAGIVRKVTCHGSFETASCLACKRTVSCDEIRPQIETGVVPRCGVCTHALGILKPDIVFFGESLGEGFERHIQRDLPRCDALLVVGSSMRVQPVAAIPAMLPADVPQVLINRERVLQPHQFDIELLGECDVIVAELARRLGWQGSLDAPGAPAADGRMETVEAAFEFVAPNRYLFKGAILPSAPEPVVAAGAPAGCEDDTAGTRAAAPSAEAAGSGPAEVGAAASAGASGLPPCGADAAAPLRTSADR